MRRILRRRRACGSGFTLIEMIVVVGIISFFMVALVSLLIYAKKWAQQKKCDAFIHSLTIAVDQYYMRYRAYPPGLPGSASPVTNADRSDILSRGQNTTQSLHFYLGAPRLELIGEGPTPVYAVRPPLFSFENDQLGRDTDGAYPAQRKGDAVAFERVCATRTTQAQIMTLLGAVGAKVQVLIDPWDNNLWYGCPPSPPAPNGLTGKPAVPYEIESPGPPDSGSGTIFSWYTGTPGSFDNDVVSWKKSK